MHRIGHCFLITVLLHLSMLWASEVILNAPLTTTIVAQDDLDKDARSIQAQITVPADAPADLGIGAFIKDDDGAWFQLAHPHVLTPGHHHLHFDLCENGNWRSEPGLMQWSNYQRDNGQEFGLYFWSEHSSRATIQLHSIRAVTQNVLQADRDPYTLTDIAIDSYSALSGVATAQTGQRWSLYCNPVPFPSNPYNAADTTVDLIITTADGAELRFPCFYKQDMLLSEGGNHERAEANAIARFCGRFRPMLAGTYGVSLEANWLGPDEPVVKRYDICKLTVRGSAWDDIVRVDKRDPRFFSVGLGDGQFYWPCGLNIQCISDKRAVKNVQTQKTPFRGFLAYKAYLDRLARAGGNSAEIWLSSWNLALEWNDAWTEQHGVGKYSEANAERLDQLLDYAFERGIRIILVINNHGQASSRSDPEWKESPYNVKNGGWLTKAGAMFTDERVKHHQAQLRRYIIGRYADHPAIMCWKMWSEMNLTGARRPQLLAWHADAFNAWHEADHYYRHPVTSHWCGDYRVPDVNLVKLPQMDFIAIDAYHKQKFLPKLLMNSTLDPNRGLGKFKKPVVVTEFGGNWNACPKPQLRAEHRIGAWCALMSGHGSGPHLWWFEWVDQKDLWQPYQAIAQFLEYEDLRGSTAQSKQLAIFDNQNKDAGAVIWNRAWLQEHQVSGYLLDHAWADNGLKTPLLQHYQVHIPIKAGAYRVEWWDASLGLKISESQEEVKGTMLHLLIPEFRRHLAYKVRPLQNSKTNALLGKVGTR